jgi:hypothetical protein
MGVAGAARGRIGGDLITQTGPPRAPPIRTVAPQPPPQGNALSTKTGEKTDGRFTRP